MVNHKKTIINKTRPVRNAIVWVTTLIFAPELHNKAFTIETRPMTKYLKKHAKTKLIGAEVGVEAGVNSLSILQNVSIEKLHLIDQYKPYVDGHGEFKDPQRFKIIAQKRLNKYKDKTVFHYETSLNAPNLIPNELDFVYIDADHNYEAVKADIAAWYPKVKKGGVLGGHDIAWDGVFWAVEEFVKSNNLRLFVDYCDWWIVKGLSWNIEKS